MKICCLPPRCSRAVALVGAAVGMFLLTGCEAPKPWVGPSFKPLFDGQTLNGWALVDQKGGGYGVTNGVIYCAKGESANLLTEKEYDNFVLRFEFKLEEGSNNGLAIRAPLAVLPTQPVSASPAQASCTERRVITAQPRVRRIKASNVVIIPDLRAGSDADGQINVAIEGEVAARLCACGA